MPPKKFPAKLAAVVGISAAIFILVVGWYWVELLQLLHVSSHLGLAEVGQQQVYYIKDKMMQQGGKMESEKDFDDLFLADAYGGQGFAYLVDENGRILAASVERAAANAEVLLVDALEKGFIRRETPLATMQQSMKNQNSGYFKCKVNNAMFMGVYTPLGLHDWYVFSIVPEAILNTQSKNISFNTTVTTVVVGGLLFFLFFYMTKTNQQHIKQLFEKGFMDELTKVGNKNKLEMEAPLFLEKYGEESVFVVLDVEKMKVFNDTFGFETGDKLLQCIAKAMKNNIEPEECIARSGSDEFSLLLHCKNAANAEQRLRVVADQVAEEFYQSVDTAYNLVLKIGVYSVDQPSDGIRTMADKARLACQATTNQKGLHIGYYDDAIRHRLWERQVIENRMENALKAEEFQLYLQPKYHIVTEQMMGAEALVRWETSDRGMILPSEFIPLFEQNGFITKLDFYMLHKACAALVDWIAQGIDVVPISVNFSRLHLTNQTFVQDVAELVDSYGVDHRLIELELTESTIYENELLLEDVLDHLHALHFSLSMDDFGSGYSSLGLLKNLSVDVIKLDKTFFTQYRDFDRAKTVIASVLAMARALHITSVAEGVETQEHIDLLRALGCDIVQGYYYAKPMPTKEFSLLSGKSFALK